MTLVCADSAWRGAVLAAQRLVVVVPATGTLRKREFAIHSPGQQPSLHIFVADVVAGLDLTIGLPHLSEQPLVVGDVRIRRDSKNGEDFWRQFIVQFLAWHLYATPSNSTPARTTS